MPSPNCNIYQVKICHDVFQLVCKIHTPPEKCSNEAYQTTAIIPGEQEERDQEDEVKVASNRANYQKAMDTLFSIHGPVLSRPRKKFA